MLETCMLLAGVRVQWALLTPVKAFGVGVGVGLKKLIQNICVVFNQEKGIHVGDGNLLHSVAIFAFNLSQWKSFDVYLSVF